MRRVTEKLIASVGFEKEYAVMTTSRSRILSMLAIINVFVNLLNFFSLALNNKATIMKVIPATRSNTSGQ